jgi:class 3 adenylate cyclase
MAKLPRGTVSLLFTDIEGSTTLLHTLGRERYVRSLEAHRQLVRNAFSHAGGVEVEMQGDSFFFAFPYARDAVAAAVTASRALADHDWDGPAIRIRIGVHTGEPSISGDLYAGLDVHRAARVMAAAHGGQILLSARTTDLVEGELPPEVTVTPVGRYLLKDFDRPEQLAQVVAPGLPSQFPAPRAEAGGDPSSSGGYRRRASIVGAVLLLLAAGVGGVLAAENRKGGATSNVVVAVDPQRNAVIGRTPVGRAPTSISAGLGGVWVVNAADATLTQIDEEGRALRTIGTNGNPVDVLARSDSVWVANRPNLVVRLNPDTGDSSASVKLKTPRSVFGPAMWLESGRGSVWVVAADRVTRFDPKTREAGGQIALPTPDWGPFAIGFGAIWMSTNSALYRLDARNGRTVATVALVQGPVVVAAGSVWTVEAGLDVVAQIDPRTNTIVRTVTVGMGANDIAYGHGSLWVTSSDGLLTRIDPRTARVTASIRVGGSPQDVAVDARRVWVSSA